MVALLALLAVGLGIPYVARWVRHPGAAGADLMNPVVGALHATFPAGLLVLAVGIATVGPSVLSADATFTLVAVLAAIGIVLGFAMSVVFAALLFTSHGVEPRPPTAADAGRTTACAARIAAATLSALIATTTGTAI